MPAVSLEGMSQEAIAEIAGLAKSLSDNPKTRGEFLTLLKKADPNVSIPEVDIPARLHAGLQPTLDRLTKMEQEANERSIRDTIKDRRELLVTSKGINREDIPAIEKLMVEKGISSHETAAEFFMAQRNSAPPTPSDFSQPAVPRPDMKAMGGNIGVWARNEATSAISDIIKNRGRAA
jgi:hypothetical protein